jgi:predicted RNA-binding protein with PIN domain
VGRTYLIDGYNLMHQAPPFSDPSSGSLEERREGLLLRLATYAAIRGTRLQVVFDGPRSASGRSAHPGLSVRFVPAPADNYLRGVIARRQGDRSLVVVTSDRKDIGGYAQASGIEWMTSPDFWAWISRPPRLKGSPDTPDEDASRPSGWTSQDDDDLLKAFGEDGGDDK